MKRVKPRLWGFTASRQTAPLALAVLLVLGVGGTPRWLDTGIAWAASPAATSGQAAGEVSSGIQGSSGGREKAPIDPIRVVDDERGDLFVSAGLELSPSGFEGLAVVGDDVTAYAEARTEATAIVAARYVVTEGLSFSLGLRTGLLHQREAWYGGPETDSLSPSGIEFAGAGLHYRSARSATGHSAGMALRAASGTIEVEASLSQIRDPLLLFGAFHYQVDPLSKGGRSIGLGAGVAFVANERVTLRGSMGLALPLTGLKTPTSTTLVADSASHRRRGWTGDRVVRLVDAQLAAGLDNGRH